MDIAASLGIIESTADNHRTSTMKKLGVHSAGTLDLRGIHAGIYVWRFGTDPSGEECSYEHRDTKLGGHITQEVTQGYGPRDVHAAEGAAGKYQVRLKYFAQDAKGCDPPGLLVSNGREATWPPSGHPGLSER